MKTSMKYFHYWYRENEIWFGSASDELPCPIFTSRMIMCNNDDDVKKAISQLIKWGFGSICATFQLNDDEINHEIEIITSINGQLKLKV